MKNPPAQDASPKTTKAQRTRAALVSAGKKVFERDGFLSARVTDIAAAASVSHGSFYYHFESKEHLFREIAEQVEVRLLSMDDVRAEGGPLERIRAANRSYLTAYKKEAKIMRVIEEVSRYDADVRAVRTKRDNDLAARMQVAMARLQAEGLADARIDTRYAANALGGMVARFAEAMFIGRQKYDFDHAVEQLTLLWANALGIRTSERPGDKHVEQAPAG